MHIRRLVSVFLLVLSLSFSATAQKKSASPSKKTEKTSRPKDPDHPYGRNSKAKNKPKAERKAKTKKSSSGIPAKSSIATRAINGRIARSPEERKAFMKETGYPKGRKGYIVDHVVPLECGGADSPANMQWQTVTEAKAKDKTERACRK